MGTRADFYAGIGESAEWLGSVAFDGYEWKDDPGLLGVASESDYRRLVAQELGVRDDRTMPDEGWPWPWSDSRTTDYAYCWDGSRVMVYNFGHLPEDDEDSETKHPFPDMSDVQNVKMPGTQGSGCMVITVSP